MSRHKTAGPSKQISEINSDVSIGLPEIPLAEKTNIVQLPIELQILILKKLPFTDLFIMRRVSRHFDELVGNVFHSLVKDVSLPNTFLNVHSKNLLSWFSSQGNLEATIKLGIAYLYHEGLTDTAGNRQESSSKAAGYFCEMEKSAELKSPITWVLVRPPWSSASVCRKAYAVRHLIKVTDEGDTNPRLLYCIGKVFQLFEDNDNKRQSAKKWMQRAASYELPNAIYELWKMELESLSKSSSIEAIFSSRDPGYKLSLMRRLRKVAASGYYPAQLQLFRLYALGYYEGLSAHTAMRSVREFFEKSLPASTKRFADAQPRMNSDMRFILIDWLIEVATMKNFSSATLHAVAECVDRFLRLRELPRSYLQLLGIACMVLCTRSIEKDVLTIREAVWLTDSAYRYEELVRMMEDVISTLKGNIMEATAQDYLLILLNLSEISREGKEFAQFLCDCSLLCADVITHPPSVVASACILLGNLTADIENPWASKMSEFTGFTKKDLAKTALQIHASCISRQLLPEYKNLKLNSIEERYRRSWIGPIKLLQIVSHGQLTMFLESEACTVKIFIEESKAVKPISQALIECSQITDPYQDAPGGRSEDCYSDEEETDTPPTFSCAYLVKPDTKTRKRIRTNTACQSQSPGALYVKENNTEMMLPHGHNISLNSKVFSSEAPEKKILNVPNKLESKSPSPRTVSPDEKENSLPGKQRKILKKVGGLGESAATACSSKSMKSMR